ncbi:hypothetical protein [Streptomyces sp. NBC_00859]|uniref:hypothetical protein n=1 Tax=Streptomyces sp. NBC_00859 TaxID=2903682 RepID=UPI00386EF903|nr:hypothetical protein OG584_08515 [Streptomyces sp. NBC_00859]
MLALRLARGSGPVALLRRLLVAAASAGTGLLLLCALGYAVGHSPRPSGAGLRLLWCLVPLAAAVRFATAVARTDPGTRPSRGATAAGLGPAGRAALSAVSTALFCVLGSGVALLVFFHLRDGIGRLPFGGTAPRMLGAGSRLPLPAALVLLAPVPLAAAAGSAWAVRERRPAHDRAAPRGLVLALALVAVGAAAELYAAGRPGGAALPVPGRFDGAPAGVLAGWSLTALGLAVAGPALTHLCGRVLQSVRPGAVRLLAGRVLQSEARRIGRPLGVCCAVVSGLVAACALRGAGHPPAHPLFGALTSLGAALVVVCSAATLLTAAVEARQERAATTAALLRGCAPASLPRSAALLRTAALVALFTAVTWAVSALAAVPLSR